MGVPRWLEKIKPLDNKRDEKQWAKKAGGQTQPNSGRFWWAKGDGRNAVFLFDNKQTQKDSYTLTIAAWRTLLKQAQQKGLQPAFIVEFVREDGKNVRVAMIPADMLTEGYEDESA